MYSFWCHFLEIILGPRAHTPLTVFLNFQLFYPIMSRNSSCEAGVIISGVLKDKPFNVPKIGRPVGERGLSPGLVVPNH